MGISHCSMHKILKSERIVTEEKTFSIQQKKELGKKQKKLGTRQIW
jgi:hypothetical protein